MARKRSRKKKEKLQRDLAGRLEELYRRGEDERFLELTREHRRELPAEHEDRRGEVLERACRRALAAVDLPQLERLLAGGHWEAPAPPLVRLAAAVVALEGGRLEEARAALAALDGSADLPPELATGLVPGLQIVAGGDGDPPPASPAVLNDLRELRRVIGRLADESVPADGRRPRRPRATLEQAASRTLWDLIAGLAALDAGEDEPAAREVRRLRKAAAELAAAWSGERLAARLQRLEQELGLAADLMAAGRRRGSRGERPTLSRQLASWLDGAGGKRLEESLTAELPSPLLVPVRRALRRHWRSLLDEVLREEGSAGLAALAVVRPELLAADLELASEAPSAAETLRQGALARQRFAARDWQGLARLLKTRSAEEREPGALAALWSLELWTLDRLGDRPPAPEEREPPHHRALVRLEEMARGIGRRFPRESQGEVARHLRDELFHLCEQVHVCDHTLRAATALAAFLPDDAGLAIVELTAAVVTGDRKARHRAEERLTHRGPLRDEERETARRMVAQVAFEDPAHLAPVFHAAEPLFTGADWQQVRELAAREMEQFFASVLQEMGQAVMVGDFESSALAFVFAMEKADALEPALAGTAGFEAAELALEAWSAPERQAEKEVKQFARAFPELPHLMAAARLLIAGWRQNAPPGVEVAFAALAPALIRRLDHRWPLWLPVAPFLALVASPRQIERLKRKLAQLAREADPDDRQEIEAVRAAVEEAERFTRRAGEQTWQPPAFVLPLPPPEGGEGEPKRRKRRRRRVEDDQLQLDFG